MKRCKSDENRRFYAILPIFLTVRHSEEIEVVLPAALVTRRYDAVDCNNMLQKQDQTGTSYD